MITIKELLLMAKEKLGITQKEMALILGYSEEYLSQMINGVRDPDGKQIEFARKFNIPLKDVLGENTITEKQRKPIPVISWVSAGLFSECIDAWPVGVSGEDEPVFSTKKTGPHAFGLRVVGHSMFPRYMPGDVIVVDPDIKPENGAPCIAWLNGEVTFKFFKEIETEIILFSMNEKYPEIVIKKDRNVDFKIIGKVVDMVPKL